MNKTDICKHNVFVGEHSDGCPQCKEETIARLRQQLKDTRDELDVYRLASERAIYDAQQFDASLFLAGDRGVEDVMRRVLGTLDEARRELVEKYNHLFEIYTVLQKAGVPAMEPKQTVSKIELLASTRDLWEKRANALLEIAKAAGVIVGGPYQLSTSQGNKWACLVNKKEFDALQSAVETYKRMSEEEGK